MLWIWNGDERGRFTAGCSQSLEVNPKMKSGACPSYIREIVGDGDEMMMIDDVDAPRQNLHKTKTYTKYYFPHCKA